MTQTTPQAEGLKRNAISGVGVVFLVLAAASPLIGLTGAIPSAMVIGNGLGAPLAYTVVGAVLLVFASAYVAMSRQVTNAGALYAYVGRGLGLRLGLGAGGIAIWAYTAVQAAVYGFFGPVFSGRWPTGSAGTSRGGCSASGCCSWCRCSDTCRSTSAPRSWAC